MSDSYIQFTPVEAMKQGKKTATWLVETRDDKREALGVIKWYGPWRCYAFFPYAQTIFECKCLANIAEFCKTRTQTHLQLARQRRDKADGTRRKVAQ